MYLIDNSLAVVECRLSNHMFFFVFYRSFFDFQVFNSRLYAIKIRIRKLALLKLNLLNLKKKDALPNSPRFKIFHRENIIIYLFVFLL
jgi:hypothetical protein